MEYKLTNGNTLKIIQDENPTNPRTDYNQLTTMVCFHSRYDLGDKHDYNHKDYNGWGELEKAIIKKEKPVFIFPLYLYDHSGITISTAPFSCPWDSGQIGFVYVTREKAYEWLNIKRITNKIKEKIRKGVLADVTTYDQYLTGDVYGFDLVDPEDETIDSCNGFYGDDPLENGMLNQAGIEVTELIGYKL